MPGQGSRKKAASRRRKAKPPAGSSPSTETPTTDGFYLSGIDNVPEWTALVGVLCTFFNLPDIATRSGLKKIHANFDDIYSKMDELYRQKKDNIRVRGAIVGIFAKMSVDYILCSKLFDKDILGKIMPLLQADETRHLALRALSTITHHSGAKTRIEIARHANILTKLVYDLPDDETVGDLCIATLTHSIIAVFGEGDLPAQPNILEYINLADVLKIAIQTVKKPYPHPWPLIQHVMELLSVLFAHSASTVNANPSALNFIVAGLRSKDWICRAICMGRLLVLQVDGAEVDDSQPSVELLLSVAASLLPLPQHLADSANIHGWANCEIHVTACCISRSFEAMLSYAQDRDLYALGLKQVALVLETEFALADGWYQENDLQTDGGHDLPMIPFNAWRLSIPLTADAIRLKGTPGEEDLADILDLYYLIRTQDFPEVTKLAERGVRRNPRQPYFWFALSLTEDHVQGLRAAKKGLKCDEIAPYVKHKLLYRAVGHAAVLGVHLLQEALHTRGRTIEEGISFLKSALEDAKVYMDEAPPDALDMKNVGYWCFLLNVLVNPAISPDLRELDDVQEKIRIAEEFGKLIGMSPKNNYLRLAQQALVQRYYLGVKEFGHIFSRLDEMKPMHPSILQPTKIEDDLAAWLEEMQMEDGTMEEMPSCGSSRRFVPDVNENHLSTLYRCSWCRNPSAVLRKCSSCYRARYCDIACQKAHWSDHKNSCGSEV